METNIDKLHNMANSILGIENVRYYDNQYRLTIINSTGDYLIIIKNSLGDTLKPSKTDREEDNFDYRLNQGIYYLRAYTKDKDNKAKDKIYYEEIYVSSEMMDMSRTIKL